MMTKPYVVTYDLDSPGQRYEKLQKAITEKASNGVWAHYLESTYFLRSELTAQQIFDILEPFIDKNDKIMVTEIAENNHQGWLTDKQWEYFNNNIAQ